MKISLLIMIDRYFFRGWSLVQWKRRTIPGEAVTYFDVIGIYNKDDISSLQISDTTNENCHYLFALLCALQCICFL